jgi:hypothetical protein
MRGRARRNGKRRLEVGEPADDHSERYRRGRKESGNPMAELAAQVRAVGISVRGSAGLVFEVGAQDVALPRERAQFSERRRGRRGGSHMQRSKEQLGDQRCDARQKDKRSTAH